jgi:putative salt-induced outer membrane protein YdiY
MIYYAGDLRGVPAGGKRWGVLTRRREATMRQLIPAAVLTVCAMSAAAQEAKVAAPWNTTIAAGVNLSRGNTRNMLLNGSVISAYKQDANEAKVGVEANYGETETTTAGAKKMEKNVENARAFGEYRRLLNDRTYGYVNGEIRNDDIASIDYRLMIGPGIGQYLLKDAAQTLGVEAGATYVREKLAGKGADDFIALRVAQNYEWKVSATSRVWESAEYLPAFEDFGRYLLNAEAGAEAAMSTRLSLRIVLQDKYNSDPATGKKANDVVLIGGLTYKL